MQSTNMRTTAATNINDLPETRTRMMPPKKPMFTRNCTEHPLPVDLGILYPIFALILPRCHDALFISLFNRIRLHYMRVIVRAHEPPGMWAEPRNPMVYPGSVSGSTGMSGVCPPHDWCPS